MRLGRRGRIDDVIDVSRVSAPPPPVLRARAPAPPKQKHQGISEITDRYIGVTCAAGKKMISEKAQDEHFFVN